MPTYTPLMTVAAQPSLPFPEERKALTVGELTRRIKKLLEDGFRFVTVTGEISNLKSQMSGHVYFTLKDADAQLPCIIWKTMAAHLGFRPEDGMQVVAWGRIAVYAPYGKYQLIVEGIEPRGVGALQLRFEQLKEKLAKEGLFEQGRKRPLPFLPRTIAIVTSPTGAAIQDMLRTIFDRFPRAHVLLYPVKVQGEGAAEDVAGAIRSLNAQRPDVDVIIAGRGGGSLEDLWAFNEEVVARAIFESKIPVVSAVGHETDFTISDFVADVRALTPTDAATKVVPRLSDLEETLGDRRSQLRRALESRAQLARARLDGLSKSWALRAPETLVRDRQQRLDDLGPRLKEAIARLIERRRKDLEARRSHLAALDPRAILRRGYTITQDAKGRILSDARGVKVGGELRTILGHGELKSRVEEVRGESPA